MDANKDFVKAALEDPSLFGGFKILSYEESKYSKGVFYGHAVCRIGMTHVYWATDGHSCTYFGDKLEPNIGVSIKKDGDTRTAFNGYCFTRQQFETQLNLTW